MANGDGTLALHRRWRHLGRSRSSRGKPPQVLEDRRDGESSAALSHGADVLVRGRGTREIDVDPRDVANELLQEETGRQSAAPALTSVLHVGDLGLQLLEQALGQGEAPHLL